jgi:hypothetical protein
MAERASRPPAGGGDRANAGRTDWAAQAADSIERVVGAIRDKTSVPLTTVARGLVFGLVVAVMGLAAVVLVAVALVRAIDVFTGEGNVWIAHFVVGGIFSLAGAFLLRKATSTTTR